MNYKSLDEMEREADSCLAMCRLLKIGGILVLLSGIVILVLSLTSMAHGEEAAPTLHPVETYLIQKVNAERARYGLQPLQYDPNLQESARRHCAWMVRNYSMVHSSGPYAENIAMGQPTADNVMVTWMNSSGHRANILGNYRCIGVCGYTAPNGTVYWCQQFSYGPMARSAQVVANVAATVAAPIRYMRGWRRR